MNWYLRRVSLNAVSVTSNYQLPNLEAALTRRRAGRFLPVPSPLYPAQGRHRDVSCLEFSNFDIIYVYLMTHYLDSYCPCSRAQALSRIKIYL